MAENASFRPFFLERHANHEANALFMSGRQVVVIEAADIFLSNNFELFEPSLAETGRKHRKCDGDFSALGYFIAVWQDFYSAKWNISSAEIYISESEAVNAARKYGTNTILYPEKDTVRFLYPPDSQIA